MNARMVTKAHIDALIAAALVGENRGNVMFFVTDTEPLEGNGVLVQQWGANSYSVRTVTSESAASIGQMLLAENMASVNARYAQDDIKPVYEFTRPTRSRETIEILMAIDGYTYQACEHDGWAQSDAAKFCEALRKRLIKKLPGYEEAQTWLIEDDTPNLVQIRTAERHLRTVD